MSGYISTNSGIHHQFRIYYKGGKASQLWAGADPGFFLGGAALVSCSTSTPINHIVFLQNTSCIRKPQVISGGGGGVRTPCTLPLDPPLMGIFLWRPDSIGSKWQEIRILVTATLVLTFFIKSR